MRFRECFGVAGGGTLEVSLQRGNVRFPLLLIHRYAAQFVASCSCKLSYALDLV